MWTAISSTDSTLKSPATVLFFVAINRRKSFCRGSVKSVKSLIYSYLLQNLRNENLPPQARLFWLWPAFCTVLYMKVCTVQLTTGWNLQGKISVHQTSAQIGPFYKTSLCELHGPTNHGPPQSQWCIWATKNCKRTEGQCKEDWVTIRVGAMSLTKPTEIIASMFINIQNLHISLCTLNYA